MQVGDLVRYVPYGQDEPDRWDIGIIVNIDDGHYEVHFTDWSCCDLIFSELEAV